MITGCDSSGYPCYAVAGVIPERALREKVGRCDAGCRRVSLPAMFEVARTYPPHLMRCRTISAGDAVGITAALARALLNRFSTILERVHRCRFDGSARGEGFLFSLREVHYEHNDGQFYALCALQESGSGTEKELELWT